MLSPEFCCGRRSLWRAMNSLWCSISGAMPYSRQSFEIVRTQCGQMATIFCTFAVSKVFSPNSAMRLKDKIVAQPARRIAGAFFFLQNAEGGSEMLHDAGEVGDDLATLGVVSSHAAEPEAILLGPVEDGEGLLLDEFVALHRAQAERVALFFQRQKQLWFRRCLPTRRCWSLRAAAQ